MSNPRPNFRPGKTDPIFWVGSSRVSGNQTRFLSCWVLGHSKPNLTQPNITPSSNIEKFYI